MTIEHVTQGCRRAVLAAWRGSAALLFGVGSGIAGAQPIAPPWSAAPPVEVAPQLLFLVAERSGWSGGRAIADVPFARRLGLHDVGVVEVAPEPRVFGRPPQRAHHALSLTSAAVRDAVRAMGIDASECAAQMRVPARLRPAAMGSPPSIDLQAEFRVACRF